jgi:chemotaxis protein methyltransferase CheR
MRDSDCIQFLQWCLPKMQLRWAGYRKVRRQVCKRIARRIQELKLSDINEYKDYLNKHYDEWLHMDSLSHITISRFYRDKGVFDLLRIDILPYLASRSAANNLGAINCLSIGSCGGEEPYTLQILWKLFIEPYVADAPIFKIIATEVNPQLLNRAREGFYNFSSLKDLPDECIEQAFTLRGRRYVIQDRFKENIQFCCLDIRHQLPQESFHLILCRNLVFTYFEESLQNRIIKKIISKLLPYGFLIVGAHEKFTSARLDLVPYKNQKCIYIKKR